MMTSKAMSNVTNITAVNTKSLLTAFIFSALMFATFDIAFDVIMPKGPLEAAFGY